MTFSIACPECKTTLKSTKPIPAGKVITCPKCSVMFPAPAVKPKPVAVPAGVDVVEEDVEFGDVEIVEDPPKKKEKPKPKVDDEDRPRRRRPQKSNTGLIIGLCAGFIGLVAFAGGAFFAVRWLLAENNDPIAYLPTKPMMLMSVDMNRLFDSPFGPSIEPLLSITPLGKYCQDTGSTPRAMLDRVTFGLGQGSRAGLPGAMSIVLVGKSGFDRQKFANAFGAKPATFGGRNIQQIGSGAAAMSILFTSKLATVVTGPVGDAEEVIRTSGRNSPPVIFSDMIKRVSNGHIWAVYDPIVVSLDNPGTKALPEKLRDLVRSGRCMGSEVTLAGDNVESHSYYLMGDPATAELLVTELKSQAKSAAMMLPLNPAEPPTVTSQGPLVTTTEKYKTADLVAALGALSKMASMMAPTAPPSGGRGR